MKLFDCLLGSIAICKRISCSKQKNFQNANQLRCTMINLNLKFRLTEIAYDNQNSILMNLSSL